jgi:hypothetical protein
LPWVDPQPEQLSPIGDLNRTGNEVSNQGGRLHSGQTHNPFHMRQAKASGEVILPEAFCFSIRKMKMFAHRR